MGEFVVGLHSPGHTESIRAVERQVHEQTRLAILDKDHRTLAEFSVSTDGNIYMTGYTEDGYRILEVMQRGWRKTIGRYLIREEE